MRTLPLLLLGLSSLFQALLTWVWFKLGMAESFMAVIQPFYGTEASWSAFAFSLRWVWLVAPMAGLACLVLALNSKAPGGRTWGVCCASMLVSLSMLLAMYPPYIFLQ